MGERLVGTEIALFFEEGETWQLFGTIEFEPRQEPGSGSVSRNVFHNTVSSCLKCDYTEEDLKSAGFVDNTPGAEEVTQVAVDAVFPSGSFSISGMWEFKARRGPDSKPWLKRKKGRAGRGF